MRSSLKQNSLRFYIQQFFLRITTCMFFSLTPSLQKKEVKSAKNIYSLVKNLKRGYSRVDIKNIYKLKWYFSHFSGQKKSKLFFLMGGRRHNLRPAEFKFVLNIFLSSLNLYLFNCKKPRQFSTKIIDNFFIIFSGTSFLLPALN